MSIPTPDYHSIEEFTLRSEKLQQIREAGIEPYPAKYLERTPVSLFATKYADQEVGHSEDAEMGKTEAVVCAGRLVLFRSMGKNAFAQIQDETGRIQIMLNRTATECTGFTPTEELSSLKFIEKKLDLGDIIGVEGHLFRTQKGELTIFVKRLTLLCKTLLPMPDKHSGLVDKGVRYRKRWLDLICNPEVAGTFRMRSSILRQIRDFFEERAFLEVETPVLQNVYGGAAAKPFTTHLNALDQNMFLRISLEIPLKKLIVGGMDKVFEIGKVFRNEGIDKTHNPEFTELEAYAAYWDYNDMMVLAETLFESIALKLFGTTELTITRDGTEHQIDLKAPWKRLSMRESIRVYAGIDLEGMSLEALRKIVLEKTDLEARLVNQSSFGALTANLFEELVEKHLIQPHHIIDHPIETTPLCKLHRDPNLRKQGLVERFESFILASEFCNSYTELNDPELQRELLVAQAEKNMSGDEEASPLDEEFIESICQGLPPSAGIGFGVDRLVMLFANVASIRDVLYFPLMRMEDGAAQVAARE